MQHLGQSITFHCCGTSKSAENPHNVAGLFDTEASTGGADDGRVEGVASSSSSTATGCDAMVSLCIRSANDLDLGRTADEALALDGSEAEDCVEWGVRA